jgi:hypothetical protein
MPHRQHRMMETRRLGKALTPCLNHQLAKVKPKLLKASSHTFLFVFSLLWECGFCFRDQLP